MNPENETKFRLVAVWVAAMLLSACGNSEPEGGQCQACRDGEQRCDAGLTCRGFYNSTTVRELCATPQTTQCEV